MRATARARRHPAALPSTESVQVPPDLRGGSRPNLVVRVRDQSLSAEHISEGDYLVLIDGATPFVGAVVVALHRGVTYVRMLAQAPSGLVRLESLSGQPPLILPASECEIIGVATGLIRKFPAPPVGFHDSASQNGGSLPQNDPA